jgi:hypothetical protein
VGSDTDADLIRRFDSAMESIHDRAKARLLLGAWGSPGAISGARGFDESP